MSLDERKQKILGAVVRDYVETIKPIGSEDLAARHAWGVKSATIRNEMAELSDLGFLRQPHTSAGRIPSDRGYRFYVDHLMVTRRVRPEATTTDAAMDLERLLRQTCALLTRMTSYMAVATPPRPADTRLSQIMVMPAGESRLLLGALLSTGQVLNGLRPEPKDMAASDVISVGNALNAAYTGRALDEALTDTHAAPAELSSPARLLFDSLLGALRQMIRDASEESVFYDGAQEMLRQPEFRDVSKIESLLGTVQQGTLLFQTLSRALLDGHITVVIGAENQAIEMQECSVVTAPYHVGLRERGTIGVVGPTRMDYDRAVPAVAHFARALSKTLTSLAQ